MQFDPTDKMLADAFNVIRQYDPALFARMTADGWHVATDFDTAFGEDANFTDYIMATRRAYGTTFSRDDLVSRGSLRRTPETYINAPSITAWARDNDVPVALFAADVLVHEYRHIHQPSQYDGTANEPPAFRAGSAFAAKLPAPYGARIAELSDEVLATYGTAPWQ